MWIGSLLPVLTIVCTGALAFADRSDQPNVILILIDDLGWGDLGCYGNDFVDTPRIDRLAAEGVRFTDAYAAGAVCSPTRCALQSGQNQVRIGVTDYIPGHWRPFERVITPRPTRALPLEIVTIAEALAVRDYATGYVGKWHLGNETRFGPHRQGYDFAAVVTGPHLPGRYRVQGRADLKPGPEQYRTDFEADLCIDFIRAHREEPFFLMLSPYAVHIPLAAMTDKVQKYRQRAAQRDRDLPHPVYAAMIEHCDDMVGRILDALEELGLTDRTLVVLTSDNGGLQRRYDYRAHADDVVSSLAPLRGEKGSLHEGGLRVPLVVKYPALTRPGTVCAEPVISHDLYPTFVELAGGSLPENQTIDGVSLTPLLSRPAARLPRSALFWHYPHYHHDRPASAIRERDWKLIQYLDGTDDVELFHLSADLGEERNLADEHAERVAEMTARLERWRADTLARMPLPNPGYEPERAAEWWSTRTGKPVDSDARKRFPATPEGR